VLIVRRTALVVLPRRGRPAPLVPITGSCSEISFVPGTPKRRRLQAALKQRAQAQLGPDANALDYVLSWLERGGLLAELAMDIQQSMAESVSRRWLSFVVHRLAPDAPDRIDAARRRAAAWA
jgi:hypothetical protein